MLSIKKNPSIPQVLHILTVTLLPSALTSFTRRGRFLTERSGALIEKHSGRQQKLIKV